MPENAPCRGGGRVLKLSKSIVGRLMFCGLFSKEHRSFKFDNDLKNIDINQKLTNITSSNQISAVKLKKKNHCP